MSNGPRFNGPDHAGPAAFIRAYCSDYTLWNDHCHQALESVGAQDDSDLWESCILLYKAFSAPYVAEGTTLQNIAFGSHSTFAPDRLKIGRREDEGPRIVQHFHMTAPVSSGGDDFFAVLERDASGNFAMRQLYYIDPFPGDLPEGENDFLPYL
jgi:hypothetical protein